MSPDIQNKLLVDSNIDVSPRLSGLKSITDTKFNHEVLENAGLCVVFFTSHWCNPCRSMKGIIEDAQYSFEVNGDDVKFVAVDTDENPISSTEFQVRSIPSTFLFKNGRIVSEIVGVAPRSEIVAEIKKHALFNLPDISVSSFE